MKIDRTKFQKFWKYALIVVTVALSINLPYYLRNVNLYKHPLGPGQEGPDEYSYTNKDFSVPAIVSNIIRNIAPHIGTPSKKVNRMTEQAIYRLLGNEVNNPFTTWGNPEFHISLSYHEDSAGNPLHFVFIFLSLVIVVFLGYFRKVPDLAKYSLLLTSAFLLLCFYLRWQPWNSRLHLPLFVLWSPVIGIACSRISKSQRLLFFIGLLFIIAAFPWLLKNESRPLIKNKNILNTTRRDQYFVNFPYVRELYIGATNFVRERNISDIGLILAGNDYEYPIWILLQEKYDQTIQIRHVNVSNISSRLITKEFLPNAIISTTIHTPKIQISKREYVNRWTTRLLYHSPHKFGKTQNTTGTDVPSDGISVNSQIYSVGKISVFIIKP